MIVVSEEGYMNVLNVMLDESLSCWQIMVLSYISLINLKACASWNHD